MGHEQIVRRPEKRRLPERRLDARGYASAQKSRIHFASWAIIRISDAADETDD
jgi:hypothetical protein